MAAPTFVQDGYEIHSNGGDVTLTGVASGNLIFAAIGQIASDPTASYPVSDSQGNTYNSIGQIVTSSNRIMEFRYAKNVTGGTVVVQVNQTGSTAGYRVWVVEIAGADTVNPLDDFAFFDDGSALTTHHCAPSGDIDTAANVIVLCASATSSSFGTPTANGSYTPRTFVGDGFTFAQYWSSAGALTDERGTWTSSTGRQCASGIVSFKAAAAGGSILRQMMAHHA
jgi:hypothetical protein